LAGTVEPILVTVLSPARNGAADADCAVVELDSVLVDGDVVVGEDALAERDEGPHAAATRADATIRRTVRRNDCKASSSELAR